ncbi:MAG TPA: 2-oxo-4-hydroxy-4-carboxy-5-ureidoimidazoline decarboxylase [Edaphobacter sp.]|nr:2-oxo-4-hydroxy-4-carboxy-5-ureidoimidazoline decarboxylase [Edaphobacter sp.]
MTFAEFNVADTAVARAALLQCCSSKQWAEIILARRPFQDRESLLGAADALWWTLGPEDWREAFSAHPRIGQNKLGSGKVSQWSSQEQSGVGSAPLAVLERLAKANEEYERRFGWIFLVNATGKSVPEMLHLLEARLKNEDEEELRVAAGEQARITRLRLNKMFDE